MILFLAVNGVSEAFAHSVMVRRVLSVRIVCFTWHLLTVPRRVHVSSHLRI